MQGSRARSKRRSRSAAAYFVRGSLGLLMNVYSVLADVIVVVHLAYVAYVILGQFAIMIGWPLGWRWIRNPWFRFSHLVMILIVAGEALVGIRCPLTKWEEDLRDAAKWDAGPRPPAFPGGDGDIEDRSFIGRLAGDLLFPEWRGSILRAGYYTFAAAVVLTLLLVPPRCSWLSRVRLSKTA